MDPESKPHWKRDHLLFQVWKEAFNEDDEYIDFFLKEGVPLGHTLIHNRECVTFHTAPAHEAAASPAHTPAASIPTASSTDPVPAAVPVTASSDIIVAPAAPPAPVALSAAASRAAADTSIAQSPQIVAPAAPPAPVASAVAQYSPIESASHPPVASDTSATQSSTNAVTDPALTASAAASVSSAAVATAAPPAPAASATQSSTNAIAAPALTAAVASVSAAASASISAASAATVPAAVPVVPASSDTSSTQSSPYVAPAAPPSPAAATVSTADITSGHSTALFHRAASSSPCALLTLFPITYIQNGIPHSGFYLYALGTLLSVRGRGYGKALVKEAEKFALEHGKHFILLQFANKDLHPFYSALGYHTPVYRSSLHCSRTTLSTPSKERDALFALLSELSAPPQTPPHSASPFFVSPPSSSSLLSPSSTPISPPTTPPSSASALSPTFPPVPPPSSATPLSASLSSSASALSPTLPPVPPPSSTTPLSASLSSSASALSPTLPPIPPPSSASALSPTLPPVPPPSSASVLSALSFARFQWPSSICEYIRKECLYRDGAVIESENSDYAYCYPIDDINGVYLEIKEFNATLIQIPTLVNNILTFFPRINRFRFYGKTLQTEVLVSPDPSSSHAQKASALHSLQTSADHSLITSSLFSKKSSVNRSLQSSALHSLQATTLHLPNTPHILLQEPFALLRFLDSELEKHYNPHATYFALGLD